MKIHCGLEFKNTILLSCMALFFKNTQKDCFYDHSDKVDGNLHVWGYKSPKEA